MRPSFASKAEIATLAVKTPPPPQPAPAEVPTLREFGPRWIEGHCEALRQKKAGIDAKQIILRRHLYPALGTVRLDQITTERVARFAASFAKYSRKTLANILHTLSKLLRTAVDWDVLPQMPCKIKIPKSHRTPPTFYELDTMRRLIDAAAHVDARTHALVLVGLHSGLRRGEILGLEWEDVNLARRQLVVRRNVISRYVDTPKSGHGRVVELSSELLDALAALKEASTLEDGANLPPGLGPAGAGEAPLRLGWRPRWLARASLDAAASSCT